jgi:dTDP-4-dehydrorhamnose reductase
MKRVLVTGGAGQVGQALQRSLSDKDGEFFFPGREQFDLLSESSMVEGIRALRPDLVLNLAAYTAVDRAEDEPEICEAINATAPAILARETARLMVPLVHVSTDYVFSGGLDRPYREDDQTGPINIYGRTKLAGENTIVAENPFHVIVRASWIVSPYRANFVKTMLRLATERDTIRVVADQIGCPTSADDLAIALLTMMRHPVREAENGSGIFHFSNQGEASWADLAEAVMTSVASLGGKRSVIESISTAEYPTKASRPRNSRLNTEKIQLQHGILARNWRDATAEIVRDLVERA